MELTIRLVKEVTDWFIGKHPFMLPVAGALVSASFVAAITLGYV